VAKQVFLTYSYVHMVPLHQFTDVGAMFIYLLNIPLPKVFTTLFSYHTLTTMHFYALNVSKIFSPPHLV